MEQFDCLLGNLKLHMQHLELLLQTLEKEPYQAKSG
jgi:hypothetical protein